MKPFDCVHIGKWPDRKRPILTVARGNVHEVIAYFRDDKAMETFCELLEDASRRGVRLIDEDKKRIEKRCHCPIENHNDVNPGSECVICGGMQ